MRHAMSLQLQYYPQRLTAVLSLKRRKTLVNKVIHRSRLNGYEDELLPGCCFGSLQIFWSESELKMIQQSSVYQETINLKAQIQKEFLAIKPVNTSYFQFLLFMMLIRCRRLVAFHFIILTTACFLFLITRTRRLQ